MNHNGSLPVSRDSYNKLSTDDKLLILYDLQCSTHRSIESLKVVRWLYGGLAVVSGFVGGFLHNYTVGKGPGGVM